MCQQALIPIIVQQALVPIIVSNLFDLCRGAVACHSLDVTSATQTGFNPRQRVSTERLHALIPSMSRELDPPPLALRPELLPTSYRFHDLTFSAFI